MGRINIDVVMSGNCEGVVKVGATVVVVVVAILFASIFSENVYLVIFKAKNKDIF